METWSQDEMPEISVYQPEAGEDIEEIAKKMVDMAQESGKNIRAEINNFEITVSAANAMADRDAAIQSIIDEFEERRLKAAAAYWRSPAGQKEAANLELMRQKYNILVDELPNIKFTNRRAVLEWLCKLQKNEHVAIESRAKEILAEFEKNGYHPEPKQGGLDKSDRNALADDIIKQALCGLREYGNINQAVQKAVKDWKETGK